MAMMKIPTTEQSIRWYRRNISLLKAVSQHEFNQVRPVLQRTVTPGRMYLFQYDPKHKATLPLYDKMPLVIPIGPAPGGFLGINLHYLPISLRYQVIGTLVKTQSDGKLSRGTKVALSWDMVKQVAKLRPAQAAVKHYLTNHVKTEFMQIDYNNWEMAVALPFDNFVYKN